MNDGMIDDGTIDDGTTDDGMTSDGTTSGGSTREAPDRDGLQQALADWLPQQRWCAIPAGTRVRAQVLSAVPLPPDDPVFDHLVVAVTPANDGSTSATADSPPATQIYQVPVVYTDPVQDDQRPVVGQVGGLAIVDALHDRSAAMALMSLLADGRTVGALDFTTGPGTGLPSEGTPRVLGVEQSNTSLVYGEDVLVKVFRRLWPGINPDVEIGTVLTRVGTADVPELLGSASGSWPDPGAGASIARGSLLMAQAFQRNATDGWDLALASVRDLLAEADLHADEVGGDFAAEADRLGRTVAGMHVDLASNLPTATLDAVGVSALAGLLRTRLHDAAERVAQLRPLVAGLDLVYDALAQATEPVPVQRVHGDLHLGQTMRTVRGWRILDFEGEPARPVSERVVLDSPVRDVAGMLRSLDYAAQQGLPGEPISDDPDSRQRRYRAGEWRDRNVTAFCAGYASESGADPRAEPTLLRAYETDKAVYELMYEVTYRPSWVQVPLAALDRLAGGGPSTSEGSTS